MEKCVVCKQPIGPNDRYVRVGGKLVHQGQCASYLQESESRVSESTDSFDLDEVELL